MLFGAGRINNIKCAERNMKLELVMQHEKGRMSDRGNIARELTREHLLSSRMLRVWMARGDKQKMGNPDPSLAKSVRVPKGNPALRWCMLDISVQRCATLACSTCIDDPHSLLVGITLCMWVTGGEETVQVSKRRHKRQNPYQISDCQSR